MTTTTAPKRSYANKFIGARLNPSQSDKLDALCARTGLSTADVVRLLIDHADVTVEQVPLYKVSFTPPSNPTL